MRILGIYREANTAGKPEADIKIADAVADELRIRGHEVVMTDNPETYDFGEFNIIFSMARNPSTLDILEKVEDKGINVVNSPKAIRRCFNRKFVYDIMQQNKIPLPKTEVLSIDDVPVFFPIVLKRIDTHGKSGDTALVKNEQEMQETLERFQSIGVKHLIVQHFIEGTNVKFYGIGEKVYLPDYDGEGKEDMTNFAGRIARLLGMNVYGGDIIYNGDVFVIDFNDWPSFSSIREQAAKDIAELIVNKISE